MLLPALVSPGNSFCCPPEPGMVQTMAAPSALSRSEDSAEEQRLQAPAKGKWQDKGKKKKQHSSILGENLLVKPKPGVFLLFIT